MVNPEEIIEDIKKTPYTFLNVIICAKEDLCIIGPKPRTEHYLKEPKYGFSDTFIDRYRQNSNNSSSCHSFYFGVIDTPDKRRKLEEEMSDCCISIMQLARSGIIKYKGCSEEKMHNWNVDYNFGFILNILSPQIELFEGNLEEQINQFFSLTDVKEFFHDFIDENYL